MGFWGLVTVAREYDGYDVAFSILSFRLLAFLEQGQVKIFARF
jgi:hypothetical protein